MTPNAAAVAATAADPTTTDPDKYVSILDNPRTRVLRYHDEPGGKTHAHQHPDSLLYALSAFTRRLTFPDGTSTERSFVAGDVMWVPAQTHIGENIGTTPTEVLLVEFKAGEAD
jgi:quercetin dioxygenase-like cupin family protein